MFEDIGSYKSETDKKKSAKLDYCLSIKESRWEDVKQDPYKLGELVLFVMNFTIGVDKMGNQTNSRAVYTGFKFIDRENMDRLLDLSFEIYDVDDPEQEKIYMEKLSPEDREVYKKRKNV